MRFESAAHVAHTNTGEGYSYQTTQLWIERDRPNGEPYVPGSVTIRVCTTCLNVHLECDHTARTHVAGEHHDTCDLCSRRVPCHGLDRVEPEVDGGLPSIDSEQSGQAGG